MVSKTVLLVNAPSYTEGDVAGNYLAFPAIGVVALGTRLRNDYPDLDIDVIDGGILGIDGVKKKIDDTEPAIIGISVLTPTYKEGLEVAQYAKERHGSAVVLGNDHASFFPELILQNRQHIDYVVQAEFGEIPFSYIVGKETGQDIAIALNSEGDEKVYFRTPTGTAHVGFPKPRLSKVYSDVRDIPDLGLIADEMSIAKVAYNQKYSRHHTSERVPALINNVRGCGNGKRRCTYCGIYDLSLNEGSPGFFWDVVRKYNDDYGVNFIFEVSDSFLTFQRYIRQLIATRPFEPKERDIEFEVYVRANDVVNIPDAIQWLKDLNVTRVNIGLDSGDDNILEFLRKNNQDKKRVLSPSAINYTAVRRLAEAGITIHASFPLGALGETKDSLENTVAFIERISRDFGRSIVTLEASELVPLPNSPSWDMMLSRENTVFHMNGGLEATLAKTGIRLGDDKKVELRHKYDNQDLLEITELARDWTANFTHIDWEDINTTKKRVEQIARSVGAIFGRAV